MSDKENVIESRAVGFLWLLEKLEADKIGYTPVKAKDSVFLEINDNYVPFKKSVTDEEKGIVVGQEKFNEYFDEYYYQYSQEEMEDEASGNTTPSENEDDEGKSELAGSYQFRLQPCNHANGYLYRVDIRLTDNQSTKDDTRYANIMKQLAEKFDGRPVKLATGEVNVAQVSLVHEQKLTYIAASSFYPRRLFGTLADDEHYSVSLYVLNSGDLQLQLSGSKDIEEHKDELINYLADEYAVLLEHLISIEEVEVSHRRLEHIRQSLDRHMPLIERLHAMQRRLNSDYHSFRNWCLQLRTKVSELFNIAVDSVHDLALELEQNNRRVNHIIDKASSPNKKSFAAWGDDYPHIQDKPSAAEFLAKGGIYREKIEGYRQTINARMDNDRNLLDRIASLVDASDQRATTRGLNRLQTWGAMFAVVAIFTGLFGQYDGSNTYLSKFLESSLATACYAVFYVLLLRYACCLIWRGKRFTAGLSIMFFVSAAMLWLTLCFDLDPKMIPFSGDQLEHIYFLQPLVFLFYVGLLSYACYLTWRGKRFTAGLSIMFFVGAAILWLILCFGFAPEMMARSGDLSEDFYFLELLIFLFIAPPMFLVLRQKDLTIWMSSRKDYRDKKGDLPSILKLEGQILNAYETLSQTSNEKTSEDDSAFKKAWKGLAKSMDDIDAERHKDDRAKVNSLEQMNLIRDEVLLARAISQSVLRLPETIKGLKNSKIAEHVMLRANIDFDPMPNAKKIAFIDKKTLPSAYLPPYPLSEYMKDYLQEESGENFKSLGKEMYKVLLQSACLYQDYAMLASLRQVAKLTLAGKKPNYAHKFEMFENLKHHFPEDWAVVFWSFFVREKPISLPCNKKDITEWLAKGRRHAKISSVRDEKRDEFTKSLLLLVLTVKSDEALVNWVVNRIKTKEETQNFWYSKNAVENGLFQREAGFELCALKRHEEANKYLDKAIKFYKESKNTYAESDARWIAAQNLNEWGKHEEAKEYSTKIFEHALKTTSDGWEKLIEDTFKELEVSLKKALSETSSAEMYEQGVTLFDQLPARVKTDVYTTNIVYLCAARKFNQWEKYEAAEWYLYWLLQNALMVTRGDPTKLSVYLDRSEDVCSMSCLDVGTSDNWEKLLENAFKQLKVTLKKQNKTPENLMRLADINQSNAETMRELALGLCSFGKYEEASDVIKQAKIPREKGKPSTLSAAFLSPSSKRYDMIREVFKKYVKSKNDAENEGI